MSDPRTERLSAGAKLMDDMEALEITSETQAMTIKAYEVTINQMADKIDLLNRQLDATQASERKYMNYANTLGIQVRNNVAANVRALEIANEVAQDMQAAATQDAQTAAQSATIEELLKSGFDIGLALHPGIDGADDFADRSIRQPPLHVASMTELIDGPITASRVHIVGETLQELIGETPATRMLREMRVT